MAINSFLIWPKSDPAANKAIGDFVSVGVFGRPNAIKDYSCMAVVENGNLIAATVYHNWHPEEGVIELTSYSKSKRWLTRNTIQCMFTGPFVCLGCQLVVLRVSEKNENMIGIARKFGFSETYIPRLRGRDEGEMIFCLTSEQWATSPYNNAVTAG